MCTVSIISLMDVHGVVTGVRMVSNRDEQRDRPPSHEPSRYALGPGRWGIWPTDPLGGGTWIAGTSSGLALSLLNVNNRGARGARSRGAIIPSVADAGGLSEVFERVRALGLEQFSPFRLVGAQAVEGGLSIAELRWDGAGTDLVWHAPGPIAFVSSGLGDPAVEPRLAVFEQRVAKRPTAQEQDAFHHHEAPVDRWPEAVLMSRAGARTVSITTVETSTASAGGEADLKVHVEPIAETTEQRQRAQAIPPEGWEQGGWGLPRGIGLATL